jgi:Alpha-kinase family
MKVKETEHARQRRVERGIDKKDLAMALGLGEQLPCKYGIKYRYNGLVYIVKRYKRTVQELTCYAEPLRLQKVPISNKMAREYDAAEEQLKDYGTWKSNTVLVVDTSGSMRESDVWGARSRLHAVWVCVALDFIAHRLESASAGPFDVISIVLLGAETKTLFKSQPTSWQLYNKVVDVYNTRQSCARDHGYYVPSLATAEDILTVNSSSSCALALCFLSDGRPSDQGDARKSIMEKVGSLSMRFGRRLTFSAIGIGNDPNEFEMLQSMIDVARDYGVQASFVLPSMNTCELGISLTSTATSLTKTQTEMTDTNTLVQRNVRHVQRESRKKAHEEVVSIVGSEEYWLYPVDKVVRRIYREWYDDDRRQRRSYEISPMQSPSARFVALNKKAFGEGAERYAFRFFEVCEDGTTVTGSPLVAKESRLVLDGGEESRVKFVHTFCETQQLARRIADEFNQKLDQLRRVDKRTPRVTFLDCSVYELDDKSMGKQSVLVEEKIDHLAWHKWNANNGYVEGMEEAPEFTHDKMNAALDHLTKIDLDERRDLGAIEEGEEDDDSSTSSAGEGPGGLSRITPIKFTASDVAQAFSHFSYLATGKKRLICDLQGVFDEKSNTLKFSDPVIHYFDHRRQERRGVHGRTDRGRKGMAMFFDTHKECCGHLCRLVTGGFRRPRRHGKG